MKRVRRGDKEERRDKQGRGRDRTRDTGNRKRERERDRWREGDKSDSPRYVAQNLDLRQF